MSSVTMQNEEVAPRTRHLFLAHDLWTNRAKVIHIDRAGRVTSMPWEGDTAQRCEALFADWVAWLRQVPSGVGVYEYPVFSLITVWKTLQRADALFLFLLANALYLTIMGSVLLAGYALFVALMAKGFMLLVGLYVLKLPQTVSCSGNAIVVANRNGKQRTYTVSDVVACNNTMEFGKWCTLKFRDGTMLRQMGQLSDWPRFSAWLSENLPPDTPRLQYGPIVRAMMRLSTMLSFLNRPKT